jgi:hypothetical protein
MSWLEVLINLLFGVELFLDKSKVEYISHKSMNEVDPNTIDEIIPNRIIVSFKIITDKWNNCNVPYTTKESITLTPSEWRDIKLKNILNECE